VDLVGENARVALIFINNITNTGNINCINANKLNCAS